MPRRSCTTQERACCRVFGRFSAEKCPDRRRRTRRTTTSLRATNTTKVGGIFGENFGHISDAMPRRCRPAGDAAAARGPWRAVPGLACSNEAGPRLTGASPTNLSPFPRQICDGIERNFSSPKANDPLRCGEHSPLRI